jgi:N-methylhydantoinase A/oxoprolinase/acetone carboxylase beta subunit
LTSQLNAVRRATTVALNAHLIAPLTELLAAVEDTLAERQIRAPLMVVKGDGSLVRAEIAARRPIETVLSGPAASVVGAWHLAGRRDVWTVDVGGTTTDIAALKDGWPVLNAAGARVAGWRTMVEAINVHTTGLGGDSHVRVTRDDGMVIGPRRAIPLCRLASQYDTVLGALRATAYDDGSSWDDERAEFLTLGRRAKGSLDRDDEALLEQVAEGPATAAALIESYRFGLLARRRVAELEARGLLRRAAFTPTDALHVLGSFDRWNSEAAHLGATILARRAGMSVSDFCRAVGERFSEQIAIEVVNTVLEDEVGWPDWSREPVGSALLRRALSKPNHGTQQTALPSAELGCSLTLHRPLVAIGAPVWAYLPQTSASLHTELVIPDHAAVANAVGAVSGSIIQRARVIINPLDGDGRVRVHGLPDGLLDFGDVEVAARHAERVMRGYLATQAQRAGAAHVEFSLVREDLRVPVNGMPGQDVFLGSTLTCTAAGRPSPARAL